MLQFFNSYQAIASVDVRESFSGNNIFAVGKSLSTATKSHNTQSNTVAHCSDSQYLMTCLNKATLITKGIFCCQETFCQQKTVESIYSPFCFFVARCRGRCLPSLAKKLLCITAWAPCPAASNPERASESKYEIPLPIHDFLETMCASVIEIGSLLDVLA